MVHCDLKPENIKIAPDGVAKILDFGLAKSAYADSVDQFGNIEGTLYYLSPEQITGENVTCLSDIFSCGVVLYELLTGRRPFEGVYPAAIVYSILHEDPLPPTSIQKDLPSGQTVSCLNFLPSKVPPALPALPRSSSRWNPACELRDNHAQPMN